MKRSLSKEAVGLCSKLDTLFCVGPISFKLSMKTGPTAAGRVLGAAF
jgi:hypothetical protein